MANRCSEVILATGELSELDELKRDSDVIALRELRSARAVVAKRLEEISQNHRICPGCIPRYMELEQFVQLSSWSGASVHCCTCEKPLPRIRRV